MSLETSKEKKSQTPLHLQRRFRTLTVLSHRIAAAPESQKRLFQKFVATDVIEPHLYQSEDARLKAEIEESERELTLLEADDLDVQAVAEFGAPLLTDPARAWRTADTDQKQRLEKLYFPTGLRFRAGKFETPAKGLLFSGLAMVSGKKSRLVAHTGFEPVLPP